MRINRISFQYLLAAALWSFSAVATNEYNGKLDTKDLVLVSNAGHVYRHKDPKVPFLFAEDADGDVFKVIFDFQQLGFGTSSGKAPIKFEAQAELIEIYQKWLDGPTPPVGEVRKQIERALKTANGYVPEPVPAVGSVYDAQEASRKNSLISVSGKLPITDYRIAEILWGSLRTEQTREWVMVDGSTKKLRLSKTLKTPHFALDCKREGEAGLVECDLSISRYDHFYFGDMSFLAEFGGAEAKNIADGFIFSKEWETGKSEREPKGGSAIPYEYFELRTQYDFASYGDDDIPVWRICFFRTGNENYVHVQKSLVGATISDLFARERGDKPFELFRPRSDYPWYDGPVENSRIENPRQYQARQFRAEPLSRPSRSGNWRDQAVRSPTGP